MDQQPGTHWGMILGIGGGLIGLLVVVLIIAFSAKNDLEQTTGTSGPLSQAEDIRIKSDFLQLKTDIEVYFQTQQTYAGYEPSTTIKSDINSKGSNLVITNLSANSYLAYAKLSSNNNYYCLDSAGFTGEVTQLPSETCQ